LPDLTLKNTPPEGCIFLGHKTAGQQDSFYPVIYLLMGIKDVQETKNPQKSYITNALNSMTDNSFFDRTTTIWLRVVFAVMVCMCNTLLNKNVSDAAIHRHAEEQIPSSVVSKRLKEN
jgi:hypothetical protein